MSNVSPALSRGIEVLNIISEQKEMSLESVTKVSGYPKMSVMRILNTLCDMGLAKKDEQSKKYKATAEIRPIDGGDYAYSRKIQAQLDFLAKSTASTAEFYEPRENGMVMTMRSAPSESEVQVHARIGFMRKWEHEFDAVAAVGYALSDYAPKITTNSHLHTYDETGNPVPMPQKDRDIKINGIIDGHIALDNNYNTNGVRRMACGIIRDGKLAGALALAVTFSPTFDLTLNDKAQDIGKAKKELEGIEFMRSPKAFREL